MSHIGVMVRMGIMLIGIAAMVGWIILHFWMRAKHPELSPHLGRLILLVGMGLVVLAAALAGRRMAIRFGAVTLAIGAVMLDAAKNS